MIVTEIKPISKKQYKVFIDGEFAFVLYKGELRLYHIEENQEIKEDIYQNIIEEVLTKRAKLRAMYLLQKNSYTEFKLKEKLRQGEYPESCMEKAIEYVKSYGYINDMQYASDYMFYHAKGLSRMQLVQKLKQKGISDDIIKGAYDNFCRENPIDEQPLLHKLLKKKHFEKDLPYEERMKIVKSIMQKGFSYDKINQAIEQYGNYDEEKNDFSDSFI